MSDTENKIPEAAIDAAHNTIIGGNEVTGPDIALDLLSREQVRAILEAAAPFMKSEVHLHHITNVITK